MLKHIGVRCYILGHRDAKEGPRHLSSSDRDLFAQKDFPPVTPWENGGSIRPKEQDVKRNFKSGLFAESLTTLVPVRANQAARDRRSKKGSYFLFSNRWLKEFLAFFVRLFCHINISV